MKNSILISVIVALVAALGVVVIGTDEAVAQDSVVKDPEIRSSKRIGGNSHYTLCMEGYVFISLNAGASTGGVALTQVYEQKNNSAVPKKC